MGRRRPLSASLARIAPVVIALALWSAALSAEAQPSVGLWLPTCAREPELLAAEVEEALGEEVVLVEAGGPGLTIALDARVCSSDRRVGLVVRRDGEVILEREMEVATSASARRRALSLTVAEWARWAREETPVVSDAAAGTETPTPIDDAGAPGIADADEPEESPSEPEADPSEPEAIEATTETTETEAQIEPAVGLSRPIAERPASSERGVDLDAPVPPETQRPFAIALSFVARDHAGTATAAFGAAARARLHVLPNVRVHVGAIGVGDAHGVEPRVQAALAYVGGSVGAGLAWEGRGFSLGAELDVELGWTSVWATTTDALARGDELDGITCLLLARATLEIELDPALWIELRAGGGYAVASVVGLIDAERVIGTPGGIVDGALGLVVRP